MEGGSLFNPGFLGASFLWWVGEIADDSTWRDNIVTGKFENKDSVPGWGRRYKVRIIGLHDREEETIPSDQLPWAQVMYPVTAGSGHANASQTANLRQGMFVFGFFLDGQEQQVPVIMGVLGNNAQTGMKTRTGLTGGENFAPRSGYSDTAVPKTGTKKERVPDEGLVISGLPAECAPPPPGVKLNSFGLRADLPLTKEQFRDAQNARVEGEDPNREGGPLTGTALEEFVQQRVAVGIKNRCQFAASPNSGPIQNPTKENVDAVHQLSSGDVKREEKYQEKITLLKSHNTTDSAIRSIQVVLDNLTQKINKYLNAIRSYVDAVSNTVTDLQSLISNAACEIAKYMKIIFDKILEYVLKLLNKTLTNVVSALPASMRYLFADIKEILTELLLCLYNKITNGLCGLIEKILNGSLNVENSEEQIRRILNAPSNSRAPYVPICYSEDIVARVISSSKAQINDANNSVLNNLNGFLKDVQSQIAGVGGDASGSGALSDITSLIGQISGSMSAALSFENIKLNIFGCELKPDVAFSDYYTLARGGTAQPDSEIPSFKSLENAISESAPLTPVEEVPFAEPTRATPDINLSDSRTTDQIASSTSNLA